MKFVLSISGGGIRGIIPCVLLAEIEKRVKKPLSSCFDLIAGTSTGGIIAALLCTPRKDKTPKYTADEILDMYIHFGKTVFKRNFIRKILTLDGLISTKYSCKNIEALLKKYLGDNKLSQSTTNLLIPAYKISNKPRPYFFKTTYAVCPKCDADNPFLWECARSTSAANGYFKPFKLDSETTLLDGGVFANNPSICAYAQAKRLFGNKEKIVTVSIETGSNLVGYSFEKINNWGILQWALPFFRQTSISSSEATDYIMRVLCANGDRYFRFQSPLDEKSLRMDDASDKNIDLLRTTAQKLINDEKLKLDQISSLLSFHSHS